MAVSRHAEVWDTTEDMLPLENVGAMNIEQTEFINSENEQ